MVGSRIASWLPRTWRIRGPEHVVGVEERGVLLRPPRVGEIALHHDHIGIERSHLADDGAIHHHGVGRVTGLGAEDRADGVGGGIARAPALGLAEVHVVGGGDGREQASRRLREGAERGRQPAVGHDAVDLELVLGVGAQAVDGDHVMRAGGRHLAVTDPCRDDGLRRRRERDHCLGGADGEQLRELRAGHRHARARRPRRPDMRHGPRCRPARRERSRAACTHSCRSSLGASSTSGADACTAASAATIAATSSGLASGLMERSYVMG